MIQQVDSMAIYMEAMKKSVQTNDWERLPRQFSEARQYYKRGEGLYEFYFPGVCEVLNGPALDEADEYDDKVVEATGFQVLEELIFPVVDTASLDEIETHVALLASAVVRLRALSESNQVSDANVFEATRLGWMRVLSLGITGFDSPVALLSVRETKAHLEGISRILSFYPLADENAKAWTSLAAQTAAYLDKPVDFNAFDRAEFMVRYWRRIAAELLSIQNSLGIPDNNLTIALDMTKASFLEKGAWEIRHFAPAYNREVSQEMVALGEMLFFDPILSGDQSRSCASCHQPSNAFTDGRTTGLLLPGRASPMRNTPTVLYSGFQKAQFWDSRVHFLEDQIRDVVANPNEMHGDIQAACQTMKRSEKYQDFFKTSLPASEITEGTVLAALASYIRSLATFESRVDKYLRGDSAQLNPDEIHGLNLYMGKAKCATCHFMPLTNGLIPPGFHESESEIIGVPHQPDTARARIDPDVGKFSTYHRELHRFMFKTPTLRNIALTAPYMHNGVYQTLEQVVDFYNRGGGIGIGIDLPTQTLPAEPLGLTPTEQRDLVKFMHALTDSDSE